MRANVYDIGIRVLIYPEDNEFVAHALEMDLIGYGKDEDSAVKELSEMIRCQISFAAQENDRGLVYFPSPKELFDRWESAQAAALKEGICPDKSAKMKIRAIFLHFSKQEIEEIVRAKKRFYSEKEMACA